MFGLPIETVTMLGTALMSFILKMYAQKSADMTRIIEASIKRDQVTNDLMNDANKRGSPWVRKFIAIFVIMVAFGGLLIAPFNEIPVEFIQEIPKKSILWGLISWGKEYEIISSNGFLIPEYVRCTVAAICGFFFGPGFAKVTR